MQRQLLRANVDNNAACISEVLSLLAEIRSAWVAIGPEVRQLTRGAVPPRRVEYALPRPAEPASRRQGANMFEGVDTVVLDNELAYQDVLPVQWMALWEPPDRFELLGLEEANLLLLQACVAVEEHPARDKNEDLGPLAGEIARLDFKLNLVLQLLGEAGVEGEACRPRPRSSSTRSELPGPDRPAAAVGAQGLLRVQLRSSLPQPLELPARGGGSCKAA